MNRILVSAAAALGFAACGGEAPATAGDAVATPPAAQSVPAAEAELISPPPRPDQPAAVVDGESVDSDARVTSSPIAAAVAASTPAPAPAAAPAPAPAFDWKAGVHYTLLPVAQPVSTAPGEVEVTVIFWYGCGHCFSLEPLVEAWEAKGRPAYVKVVRMPVIWNEVAREDARLFYTIEALGKLRELNLAVFREVHVNRNPMTTLAPGNRVDTVATEKNARAFLLANGVSAEDFGRVYRSFSVENKLRQAENMSRRYLADHTPMVIVQGKYMTDVTMAGSPDKLFDVIDDLAARERSGG